MNQIQEIKSEQSDYCGMFKMFRELAKYKLSHFEHNEETGMDVYSPTAHRVNKRLYSLIRFICKEIEKIQYTCNCEICSPIQPLEIVSVEYEVNPINEDNYDIKKSRCTNVNFCGLIEEGIDVSSYNSEEKKYFKKCDNCQNGSRITAEELRFREMIFNPLVDENNNAEKA